MDNQINSVIKTLEQLYSSVIDTKEEIYYIINLNDYINFINNNSLLTEIIKEIEKQKNDDYQLYNQNQLKLKTRKELEASKKILYKIIKKNNIKDKKITELVRRIEMLGYDDDENTLNFNLLTLFDNISEKYKKGLFNQSNDADYRNYKFSKSLKLFNNKKQDIEDLKFKEVWHCWYRIKYIPEILKINFHNYKPYEGNLSEEEGKYYLEMLMLIMEIKKIGNSQVNKEWLSDCKNSLIRLHNYFVLKLRDIELSENTNKNEGILYNYDKKKEEGILKIGNKKEHLKFEGRIAMTFFFFYNKNKTGSKTFFDYIEYNNHIKNEEHIHNSNSIRIDVKQINKRVRNHTDHFIKSLIEVMEKQNPKDKNYYRWKPEYKSKE